VTMTGPHLAGGDDYRCRFGGGRGGGRWSTGGEGGEGGETRATAAAAEAAGAVVPATHDPAAGTLACTSPAAVAAAGEVLLGVSLDPSPNPNPNPNPSPSPNPNPNPNPNPSPSPSPSQVLLEVSLNAKHFHAAYGFLYYSDVALSAVSPSSGPAAGGTALALSGAGLHGGRRPECWLGAGRANATPSADGTEFVCEAPPVAAEAALGDTRLRVSLNAQQASGGLAYAFYASPGLGALHPDNGDAEGGTLVRVNVSGVVGMEGTGSFANGSDYRCRFAAAVSPTPEVPDPLQRPRTGHVPATFDPAAGSLLCTAPPMAGELLGFLLPRP
jgi:hypothetical protein